jgi:pimeloyl-ACP methyl ester carboxylesterase
VPQPDRYDHFVTIDGVRYHYTEYPGSGQDVFLLHGFASSTYTWEKVAPMLQANGYHVWALDMKGFGWSDKPEDADYSPQQLLRKSTPGWMKWALKGGFRGEFSWRGNRLENGPDAP